VAVGDDRDDVGAAVDDAIEPRGLRQITVGDDDELYAGSRARQAAETLPSGAFIEIPDADHFTLYTRGDLILPHLTAFLARVSGVESAQLPA
jgi:pimeloyl-ACP methyl ester carboxylesterase